MQAAFEDGGKPTMILLSPTQKKKFSDATEGATGTVNNQINYSAPQEVTSVGAVSVTCPTSVVLKLLWIGLHQTTARI